MTHQPQMCLQMAFQPTAMFAMMMAVHLMMKSTGGRFTLTKETSSKLDFLVR